MPFWSGSKKQDSETDRKMSDRDIRKCFEFKEVLGTLLSNWTLGPGQVKYKALYDEYCSQTSSPVPYRGFTQCANHAFPSAKVIKIRENSQPFIGLSGMRRVEKENEIKVNELFQNINLLLPLAQNCNFTLNSTSPNIIKLYNITEERCNGHVAVKEVIVEDCKISLHIAGKRIKKNEIFDVDSIHLQSHFEYFLIELSKLSLCHGFTDVGKGFKDSSTCFELWNDSIIGSVRSENCYGVVPTTTKSGTCKKCHEKINNIINVASKKRASSSINQEVLNESVIAPKSIKIDDESDQNDSDSIYDVTDDEKNDPSYGQKNEPIPENLDFTGLEKLLQQLAPSLNQEFVKLVQSQIQNSNAKNKRLRRWDLSTIQLCLSVWSRSPKSYEQLRQSRILLLPSPRQLSRYKNSVPQLSGIHDEVLRWMFKEAQREKVPREGYVGCIIFDEMSIQEDLQFSSKNADAELIGFEDFPSELEHLHGIRNGNKDPNLASHVLQLLFLGDTNFRFPFAHFPTKEANASDLYVIFWDAVLQLDKWGFKVNFTCMDGAIHNRTFIGMHFDGKNPAESNYVATNLVDPSRKLVFVMDPAHNFKKLRNSLLKRKLDHKGRPIEWHQWRAAYEWDRTTNPIRVHHKLTHDHLYPEKASKMRNKLATDVLGTEMLHLMKVFKENTDRKDLDGTIELLEITSTIVSNFGNSRPVRSRDDTRIQDNVKAAAWFTEWSEECSKLKKTFISVECYKDLMSMFLGCNAVIKLKLDEFPLSSIYLHRLNSDVVENIFCSQRGICNGSTTNPTYYQFSKGMNTIIIGQSIRSRKSNAGSTSCLGGALPYKVHTQKSFKSLRL